MLFDSNVYYGHFPFRKTSCKEIGELKAELGKYGIDRAIVSSLPAVYYRDCMEGNLELFNAVKGDESFLPAAVLNPAYPRAEQDLIRCHKEFGVKVVKLFPAYHDYHLQDSCAVRFMKLAASLGVAVSIPASIENPLQRHPLDANRYICEEELVAAATAVPEANILFHNSAAFLYAKKVKEAKITRSGRIYYDFARVDLIDQDTLAQLIDYAGEDAVVLGSGTPLCYTDVQILKLQFMQMIGWETARIKKFAWKNLFDLLGD